MPKKTKAKPAQDPAAEIVKLKKEVSKLKKEMAILQKFFCYQRLSDDSDEKSLTLLAHQVLLLKTGHPSQVHGSLIGGKDGASIRFCDKDSKTKLRLSVHEDAGHLLLVDSNEEVAVEMGASDGKHGYIGVCDEGKPRVALRSTEQGGAVTVNHDDGLVRAYMESHANGGRVIISNLDMKPAVELGSDPQDGAGYVLANNPMGKPGAIMASDGEQGVVTLFDAQQNPTCSLPKGQ